MSTNMRSDIFEYKSHRTCSVSLNMQLYEVMLGKEKKSCSNKQDRWAGGGLTYNKVLSVCVCVFVGACA